ncbi:MAG: twin-arginine translocation signal domain-containing protein, partial [SAR324 cluster bacterium]|nr:twin-arginine translocation signal domain-containing protein [SAR324 cluster bacterium]
MSELQHLEKLFAEGQLSRRKFIARVSALGLTAAISPLMFSGSAMAATPKRGGRIIIGSTGGSTTDSMDPGTLVSNNNQNVNWQIRNCLVEIDHNFNAIPELA